MDWLPSNNLPSPGIRIVTHAGGRHDPEIRTPSRATKSWAWTESQGSFHSDDTFFTKPCSPPRTMLVSTGRLAHASDRCPTTQDVLAWGYCRTRYVSYTTNDDVLSGYRVVRSCGPIPFRMQYSLHDDILLASF